eukprot:6518176-Alexandrium_andersonii.AAC.1
MTDPPDAATCAGTPRASALAQAPAQAPRSAGALDLHSVCARGLPRADTARAGTPPSSEQAEARTLQRARAPVKPAPARTGIVRPGAPGRTLRA